MKKLFNVSIIHFVMIVTAIIAALLLLTDFNRPIHYTLLFLQPLFFGIVAIVNNKFIHRTMSRISAAIIYFSYFCRMVIVPMLMYFGSYGTLLSDAVIGPYMSEAIVLSCIEWAVIDFVVIYKTANRNAKRSLYENYQTGITLGEVSDSKVPRRLKILIVLMSVYIIYIIMQDDTVIRQNFSLMVGTPDSWYVRAGYRSVDDIGGEGVLGVMVTALLYFFWYIQALVPPVLLLRITRKRTNDKTKILWVYIVACVIFMITTGTKAHSVECALAFILLAYSMFGDKMRNSLKSIAFVAVIIVFVGIFAKSGLTGSADNISSVFSSYFGGVQNLSAAIYAKSNAEGFGINNILPDIINQIPLFGNRLRTALNLGSTTNKLFNAVISQRSIGQIIPSIGQGYTYFGFAFATLVPMIAALFALSFDNKAVNETSVIKKNVYLIAAIMMARAVAMTNLMSAVIYLFNTFVSLGIVWLGGRISNHKRESRSINEA